MESDLLVGHLAAQHDTLLLADSFGDGTDRDASVARERKIRARRGSGW
ncbi:hypothetical protein OHB33_01600 [Streptomyces sp. NBC_01558]|nr:hypothetical protein [Streptomyces sp. NBC_01558]WSD75090.1 hypothetical protein OHB33_01600 [Streptomyces sp. NBC_01558]